MVVPIMASVKLRGRAQNLACAGSQLFSTLGLVKFSRCITQLTVRKARAFCNTASRPIGGAGTATSSTGASLRKKTLASPITLLSIGVSRSERPRLLSSVSFRRLPRGGAALIAMSLNLTPSAVGTSTRTTPSPVTVMKSRGTASMPSSDTKATPVRWPARSKRCTKTRTCKVGLAPMISSVTR